MFRCPQVQRFVLVPKWSIMRARCHPPTATGRQNLVPIRHACISRAANPDSYKPEGIMWRQPGLIMRNAAGFTESGNSWIVAQPEGILGPNMQTVLGTAPLQKRNQASFRLPG